MSVDEIILRKIEEQLLKLQKNGITEEIMKDILSKTNAYIFIEKMVNVVYKARHYDIFKSIETIPFPVDITETLKGEVVKVISGIEIEQMDDTTLYHQVAKPINGYLCLIDILEEGE